MNIAKPNNNTRVLPDVTVQKNTSTQHLQWVGMEKVAVPLQVKLHNSNLVPVTASANIFVSLDSDVKGIHMSRLYMRLNEMCANQVLTPSLLDDLLLDILESHKGMSESAMVALSFTLPLNKPALLSGNRGYQNYDITVTQQTIKGLPSTRLELSIPYSSTCPCSSSLSNQLIGEAIQQKFSDETLSKEALIDWINSGQAEFATPHSQRSYAYLDLTLAPAKSFELDSFVWAIEEHIQTPVQSAVKRVDEQEFAKRNGQNLMFCEDAARRIKGFLETQVHVQDYWFKVEHQESLHAHNAVVVDQKF